MRYGAAFLLVTLGTMIAGVLMALVSVPVFILYHINHRSHHDEGHCVWTGGSSTGVVGQPLPLPPTLHQHGKRGSLPCRVYRAQITDF
jgi:hypothetical protein